MSEHLEELLPLAAAGALEPDEAARLAAHLAACETCAGEAAAWQRLAEGLGRLPAARPSRALAARTREAVEVRLAERAERAWNRAALGFLVAFAWTLAVLSWLMFDFVAGGLALQLGRPVGPTAAWYGAYVAVGWLAAGATALLVGRRAPGDGAPGGGRIA
jgi:anti-sigma factor RsiW